MKKVTQNMRMVISFPENVSKHLLGRSPSILNNLDARCTLMTENYCIRSLDGNKKNMLPRCARLRRPFCLQIGVNS
jgi:hypothetical protein